MILFIIYYILYIIYTYKYIMDNKKELSIMIGGAVKRSKKKKSPQ